MYLKGKEPYILVCVAGCGWIRAVKPKLSKEEKVAKAFLGEPNHVWPPHIRQILTVCNSCGIMKSSREAVPSRAEEVTD